jgi:uncharacterized protein (DUF433 family)
MNTAPALPHIHLDDQRRPWIDDKNIKVIEIVLEHLGHGWNAESIQENHPELTLAQVYAALAWYYDNQAEMDVEIEQQSQRLSALREEAGLSPLQRRLAMRRQRA